MLISVIHDNNNGIYYSFSQRKCFIHLNPAHLQNQQGYPCWHVDNYRFNIKTPNICTINNALREFTVYPIESLAQKGYF